MTRRLSGWARVWLIAAVLMWAGGGWWLRENPLPRTYVLESNRGLECTPSALRTAGLYPAPCETAAYRRNTFAPTCERLREMESTCQRREAAAYMADREGIKARDAAKIREHEMRVWARYGALAASPLALALMFLLGRALVLWIIRGFKTN
ncbi:MAG: hypothetical protein ABL889_19965 [Terricaulis sp.]